MNKKLTTTVIFSEGSELAEAQLEYFDLMRGPWDRQEHHKPFAVSEEKPEGAGYYPAHLEKERWNSYLEEHPAKRREFESLFTVITGGGCVGWESVVRLTLYNARGQWRTQS